MRIETIFGNFTLIKNTRDCFSKQDFEEKYTEYFNKFDFIVGDTSAKVLRLKGFYKKGRPNYTKIPDYLDQFCNYNSPYFILEKIDLEVTDQNKLLKSQHDLKLQEKYKPFLEIYKKYEEKVLKKQQKRLKKNKKGSISNEQ